MKIFESKYLYLKISTNAIEITDLISKRTVSQKSKIPFSTNRIILSSFNPALESIRNALRALEFKKNIFRNLHVLVQQTEKLEGGLSDIEKRAMRDLAEISGADKVIILENTILLNADEALSKLIKGR